MAYKNKEQDAQWRLKNRDRLLEYHRAYSREKKLYKTPEARLQHVKRLYNLDADAYLGMVLKQENLCAICGNIETSKNKNGDVRPLCVDHCHTTGKVRGLLCNKCNALLGHARDDVSILENSIKYLTTYFGD